MSHVSFKWIFSGGYFANIGGRGEDELGCE